MPPLNSPAAVKYEGIWGTFDGPEAFCPALGLVTGFRTKVSEAGEGVTGVEMRCADGTLIHGWNDKESAFGTWEDHFEECPGKT